MSSKSENNGASNHPDHYNHSNIECIDAIASALNESELEGFIKGNVIKYVWRSNHKGGQQDIEKAAWYLNWWLDIETKKQEKK